MHVHQVFDEPKLHLQVDRTKAAQSGYTQNDLARNFLTTLSGSFQTQPTFWLNPVNGVSYNLVARRRSTRFKPFKICVIFPSAEPGRNSLKF
jgi:hypothetical protein